MLFIFLHVPDEGRPRSYHDSSGEMDMRKYVVFRCTFPVYISFFVTQNIQGVSVFYYRFPHLPSTSPIFINRSRCNIRHPEVCKAG